MRNFWLVAKHEYRATVFKRAFIFLTLALPLGMIAVIALAVFVAVMDENNLPVGYVDNAGILDVTRQPPSGTSTGIEARAFPDEGAALAALENEEIQALFIFPSDYPNTLQTDLYYLEEPPNDDVWGEFNSFVRVNLVAAHPDEIRARLLAGPTTTVHDIASGREFSESSIINIVAPFVASFFFFISTMSASGYMLQVVATEKENRTLEIMVTSVTPAQLIVGKTAGLLAAALTQLSIYAVAIVVGLAIAAPRVEALQQLEVPWAYLGVMALFFFPTYVLIAGVMVAVGGAVTKLQEGQQLAGFLNLFFMLPLLLIAVIMRNPAAPVLVVLSMFPTTALLTISLRWGLGTIPLWQIGVSWVLLVAAAVFTVWAATRVFRAGMLRYGQPLNLKAAVAAIRGE